MASSVEGFNTIAGRRRRVGRTKSASKPARMRSDERRLGVRCRERFTISSWCLRRSDSATRERTPPGPSKRGASRMTVQDLWDHYKSVELPFKDFSTQDAYIQYAQKWILPRWGRLSLRRIKTVDVERWLREATVANGTKAKLKCIFSALFSHAVRWEFVSNNPISTGMPVGSGGKRGPSVGVRVSAKRQKVPSVLAPEQVKLGLSKLGFRDQLLVLLDGALGVRRGELGALRWQECDFENELFQIQHSYYWRRGGILKST